MLLLLVVVGEAARTPSLSLEDAARQPLRDHNQQTNYSAKRRRGGPRKPGGCSVIIIQMDSKYTGHWQAVMARRRRFVIVPGVQTACGILMSRLLWGRLNHHQPNRAELLTYIGPVLPEIHQQRQNPIPSASRSQIARLLKPFAAEQFWAIPVLCQSDRTDIIDSFNHNPAIPVRSMSWRRPIGPQTRDRGSVAKVSKTGFAALCSPFRLELGIWITV